MKTKIIIPILSLAVWTIIQGTSHGAPFPTTPPPSVRMPPATNSPNANPNINGPAPGTNINNGNTPQGMGQPYTMGTSNVGGFNGNPNINGPAPGMVINGTNPAGGQKLHYNPANTNFSGGLTGNTNFNRGLTNLPGIGTNWNDYTNPNGTVTYNTNVPHWWEKR